MTEGCTWYGEDSFYKAYHDEEWGVPIYDSRALYEKLILDGFQAGLSWITILRKRENFIAAFDGFNPELPETVFAIDVSQANDIGHDDVPVGHQHEGLVMATMVIEYFERRPRAAIVFGDGEPEPFVVVYRLVFPVRNIGSAGPD